MKSCRIRKWEVDANESWLEKGAESSWRWTAERQLTGDPEDRQLALDSREASKQSWRGTTDRGSQHRTPETSGRQDGVQRGRRVEMTAFQLLCGIFSSNPR